VQYRAYNAQYKVYEGLHMARCNAAQPSTHTPKHSACAENGPRSSPHTRVHTHESTHTMHNSCCQVPTSPRVAKTPRTQVSPCSPARATGTQAAHAAPVGWFHHVQHMFRSRKSQGGVYGAATQDAGAWLAPAEHTRGDTKAAACTHDAQRGACLLGLHLQSSIGARRRLLHACRAVPLPFGD
jgi:hypothetical protein